VFNKLIKNEHLSLILINFFTVFLLNYKIFLKKSYITGDFLGFYSSFVYQTENIFNLKGLIYQNLVFGGFPYIGQLQKLTFEPIHYFSSVILNLLNFQTSSLYYFYELLILFVWFLNSILIFLISKKIFKDLNFSSHLFSTILFLCTGANYHFLENINIIFGVFYITLSFYLFFSLIDNFNKSNSFLFCISSSLIFASGSVDLYFYFSVIIFIIIFFSRIKLIEKLMIYIIYLASFVLINGSDLFGFIFFSNMTNIVQLPSIGFSNYQQFLLSMNPLFGILFGHNPFQVLPIYLIFFSFALIFIISKEIIFSKNNFHKIIFLILTIFFILSSGYTNIFYNIFYEFLPLFSSFRNIHKLSAVVVILICVLSPIFFDSYLNKPKNKYLYSILILNFLLGLYFTVKILFSFEQSIIKAINLKLFLFLLLNFFLIFIYNFKFKLKIFLTYFMLIVSAFILRNDYDVANTSPVNVALSTNENILDEYIDKNKLRSENNLFFEIHPYYYLGLSKNVKQGPVYAGLFPYYYNENINLVIREKPENLKFMFFNRIFSSIKIEHLITKKTFIINENQKHYFFHPTELKNFYSPNYLSYYKKNTPLYLYELNKNKFNYLITDKLKENFIPYQKFSREYNCLLLNKPTQKIENCIYTSKKDEGFSKKISSFIKTSFFGKNLFNYMPKENFNLKLDEEKFIIFPLINFSGWELYLDGKKHDNKIYSVFGTFIGTNIDKGDHKIKFVYKSNFQIIFYIIYNIFLIFLFFFLFLKLFKLIKNYFFRSTII